MKAVVFHEGARWAVEDVPKPVPAEGEVLLEVIRTGVCGTDEHLLHGGFIAKLPLIPGHEILGRVVEHGPGVTTPAVGTVVAVDNTIHCGHCDPCLTGRALFCENFVSLGCNAAGGFAEYVAVQAAKTFDTDGMDLTTAGLAEPRNSANTCRSTSRITRVSAPDIAKLTIIPALVSWSSRCHCLAPMYCAAIALIAPPIAIAGIWI